MIQVWVRRLKFKEMVSNTHANSSRQQLDFSRDVSYKLR